jgi:adenosine deaminase
VRAGLILMMDRTFDERQNEIIVEKACRYASRGVVGIDIAGPRPGGGRFAYAPLAPLVQGAREAGLGVTVHCGEEGFVEEVGEVVEALRPDRIGHGILAAGDPELTALLASTGIVLEVCPTSNLLTGALADAGEVRAVFRTFLEAGVRVTVSTDGPEMMRTHLRDEFAFLCSIGAMSADEARAANALAHEVSFVATKEVARI